MPGLDGRPLHPELLATACQTLALVAQPGETPPAEISAALNALQEQLTLPDDDWYRYRVERGDRTLLAPHGHPFETAARIGGQLVVARHIEVARLGDPDPELLRFYPFTYLWMTGRLLPQRGDGRAGLGLSVESLTSGRLRIIDRAAVSTLHIERQLSYPPDFTTRTPRT